MMAKSKKPNPQELYWQRKRREEEEKNALLPPGLVNHGNTCFMNSTLQGLIATPLLHSLVNFDDIPLASSSSSGLAARKSPQLTNGHGRGGEYEQQWEKGMPLGDVFVTLLQKAWGLQDSRERRSLSPKEVLTTIGRKYDQYLDFRQQDAHEFLTHLLDVMRLEEIDIIKKRQPPPPPPPKGAKRRRTRASSDSQVTPSIPDEDKLTPFVDMVFRGQLASILVCDTCKKISVTTEDFHDLSLSIKPEDYISKDQRKRDRFKGIAKKLRLIPKARVDRSSSVPASPARSSLTLPSDHLEVSGEPVDTRRRSLEHVVGNGVTEEVKEGSAVAEEAVLSEKGPNGDLSDAAPKEEGGHVSFADTTLPVSQKRDDGWGKLGRRISMSMGSAARKEKRLSQSKPTSRASSRERVSSGPLTPKLVASSPLADDGYVSDASPSLDNPPLPTVPLPASSSPGPSSASGLLFSPSSRQHSMVGLSEMIKQRREGRPQQTPRSYKPSREESSYMRKVLADVNPSGSSTFSLIHQALSGHSQSSAPLTAQALLVKMGHLPGIEECLRLFTAVEVLEGENMVGCHRCWKIANGAYKPRKEKKCYDEDSEEVENGEDDPDGPDVTERDDDAQSSITKLDNASSVDTSSRTDLPGYISPASTTAITETIEDSSSIFSADDASVLSAPTTVQSITPTPSKSPPTPLDPEALQRPILPSSPIPDAPVPEYGGLPIPSISTTGPETPMTSPAAAVSLQQSQEAVLPLSVSGSSLQPPAIKKHKSGKDAEDGISGEESYDSDSEASGDTTALSDVSSIASASASPSPSPSASVERLPPTSIQPTSLPSSDNNASPSTVASKVPRAEQVILRRTYKRYLIATPPPILIIHLKRFQQTSKSPYAMSFSSGVKKLDDTVAFPEYLDLAPYLAPKKEGPGLGKKKRKSGDGEKEKEKEKEIGGDCMYRLYAVVVHIGNMLGGHYVAYTALPLPSGESRPSTEGTSSSDEKSSHHHHHHHHSEAKRQWAFISDTNVRLVSLEEVLKAKAYLCMYERI